MPEAIIEVEVRGMHCQGCASNVKEALRSLRGVRAVDVSLEEERATVRFDPTKTTEENVRRAVTKAGFLVGSVTRRG